LLQTGLNSNYFYLRNSDLRGRGVLEVGHFNLVRSRLKPSDELAISIKVIDKHEFVVHVNEEGVFFLLRKALCFENNSDFLVLDSVAFCLDLDVHLQNHP